MIIAGYHGELIANQKSNYKYAGLVHESGYLIEEDPKQYSIINKSKIEPFTEMVQFYRSHNWRYIFMRGKLIEGPLKNGFVPIPNRIPKKRKKLILVESESPAEEEKKEAVTSPNVVAYGNKKRLLFQFKKTETSDEAKLTITMVVTEKRILKP